jgi:hypothetical protein
LVVLTFFLLDDFGIKQIFLDFDLLSFEEINCLFDFLNFGFILLGQSSIFGLIDGDDFFELFFFFSDFKIPLPTQNFEFLFFIVLKLALDFVFEFLLLLCGHFQQLFGFFLFFLVVQVVHFRV